MGNNLGFGERLSVRQTDRLGMRDRFTLGGIAKVDAFDRYAWEKGKKELVWEDPWGPNKVMDEGKNLVLNAMFRNTAWGGSIPGNWYIGLYNNSFNDVGLDGTEVITDITGVSGEFTGYTEGTRQSLTYPAPANGAFASVTAATFTCNAGATLSGIFVFSAATGTSGTLYTIKPFTTGDRVVDSSVILQVSYLIDTDGSD